MAVYHGDRGVSLDLHAALRAKSDVRTCLLVLACIALLTWVCVKWNDQIARSALPTTRQPFHWRTLNIGGVRPGDSKEVLRQVLGTPHDEYCDTWSYVSGSVHEVSLRNGSVLTVIGDKLNAGKTLVATSGDSALCLSGLGPPTRVRLNDSLADTWEYEHEETCLYVDVSDNIVCSVRMEMDSHLRISSGKCSWYYTEDVDFAVKHMRQGMGVVIGVYGLNADGQWDWKECSATVCEVGAKDVVVAISAPDETRPRRVGLKKYLEESGGTSRLRGFGSRP